MKNCLLTFVWMLGIPAIMAAGAAEDLRKEETAWAAAVVARDFSALDKIFTDQLIYAHATGGIESKREYLDRLRKGAQRYDSINHEKIQVVSYGDSVVTHSILRMKGSSDGKPFDNHVMMLHLWVKQGGKWRLAAHQTTLLNPAAT